VHRVDVVAAVEVVIDEHLPVARQPVLAPGDELQRTHLLLEAVLAERRQPAV
jgi:hypothetical protein